jgi:hypothetical protein
MLHGEHDLCAWCRLATSVDQAVLELILPHWITQPPESIVVQRNPCTISGKTLPPDAAVSNTGTNLTHLSAIQFQSTAHSINLNVSLGRKGLSVDVSLLLHINTLGRGNPYLLKHWVQALPKDAFNVDLPPMHFLLDRLIIILHPLVDKR